MRQISMVAGLALAVVVLSGCPSTPTYPKCENDTHCQEKGEVCVQGQCQECATDANCKEGFTCQANKCTPKGPECTTDTQCGSGRICEAGKCATAQCAADTQCPSGSKCERGRCQAPRDTCSSNADCGEGQQCQNGRCVSGGASQCSWEPISFGFNESNLTSEAQSRLSTLAECLKASGEKVTLEGHADERGTEEYNLQLSNRRAASVKRYLTDLGIASNRLQAVGFGETRPLSTASDEEAWGQNRRVEFRR
ncbi:OmpA family protein [Hyalangium rubrum]|uniref:OmpA family protein n=1 Tax=Hyalangium rubrum TaxID=3103134 RepID=A0ABU5HAP1_9BACT|nr:OmpA family protein [Hyalangium sp. s54d21]MDY7230543.1 OmpA family protein [Hyalangium sp. s54d21]